MPELPEVETVRRMLEGSVLGRRIGAVRTSGLRLRVPLPARLGRRLAGRRIERVERVAKYLLFHLDERLSLLSHLGMSGRWLFHARAGAALEPHVHVRISFEDGAELWFQDPRRFGLLRELDPAAPGRDPLLAHLGPDALRQPPDAARLRGMARGVRASVKSFLLDQRRLAGVGNIYASETLFRARVGPRRAARSLTLAEWGRVAAEIPAVLGEAVERMGTTFSMYRTLWGEPGSYGERLFVYDRAGEPCRRCGTAIRRIVQAQRSTFYCPACQSPRPQARPFRDPGAGQDIPHKLQRGLKKRPSRGAVGGTRRAPPRAR
jgi:formamidopyrimidine-DNA glycosylase